MPHQRAHSRGALRKHLSFSTVYPPDVTKHNYLQPSRVTLAPAGYQPRLRFIIHEATRPSPFLCPRRKSRRDGNSFLCATRFPNATNYDGDLRIIPDRGSVPIRYE